MGRAKVPNDVRPVVDTPGARATLGVRTLGPKPLLGGLDTLGANELVGRDTDGVLKLPKPPKPPRRWAQLGESSASSSSASRVLASWVLQVRGDIAAAAAAGGCAAGADVAVAAVCLQCCCPGVVFTLGPCIERRHE